MLGPGTAGRGLAWGGQGGGTCWGLKNHRIWTQGHLGRRLDPQDLEAAGDVHFSGVTEACSWGLCAPGLPAPPLIPRIGGVGESAEDSR